MVWIVVFAVVVFLGGLLIVAYEATTMHNK